MLVAAITLTAAINFEVDLGKLFNAHRLQESGVTCGIRTVGYRFSGAPGQVFRYAGDNYTVPEEGWIELIADRHKTTYRIGGRTLPLDVWPLNQFGFREVPLPTPQSELEQEVTR